MERVFRHLFRSRTSIQSNQFTSLLWKSTSSQSSSISLAFSRFASSSAKPVDDKPVVYTKSKAHAYKAASNFRVTEDEMTYANSTSLIVKSSIIIFLIYFCILREPNDLDALLDRDLFEIVPDLEIPMLESDIRRLESHGVNTDELKKKVDELKALAVDKPAS